MNKKELNQWYALLKQVKNGYHMSDNDKRELLSLNHRLMEDVHDIHNKSMLDKSW